MNDIHEPRRTLHGPLLPIGPSRRWRPGPCRTTVWALLLCGFAQAQAETDNLQRLVATDAARLLRDADPVVRGEAALVVAAQANPQYHGTLLAMVQDEDAAAQLRGILALGLQATPGVSSTLDGLLSDYQTRTQPAGLAAAFALGLLPPDVAPALTSRILLSFQQTNLRRQHDTLLALLLGMSHHEQRTQATALRRLFDDDSLRDADLRAQLLQLLLPVDATFDGKQLRRLLERGSEEERRTLLAWLGTNATAFDSELLPQLERLAQHGSTPEARTLALAVLTRLHHLPALEMAAKALRSNNPTESGQGMRSVLSIGGASLRLVLEQHLRNETDPARRAAMLRGYDAPMSTRLADECAHWAADVGTPLALRTAAATQLARGSPERASPLLRDLFRATNLDATLPELAVAILRSDSEPPALSRLLNGTADLRQSPARWQALLAAGHPAAIRQVLMSLTATDSTPAERALALSIWRRTMLLSGSGPTQRVDLPQVLQNLLGS